MKCENELKVRLKIDGEYREFFIKRIEYEDDCVCAKRDEHGNIYRNQRIKRIVTLVEY